MHFFLMQFHQLLAVGKKISIKMRLILLLFTFFKVFNSFTFASFTHLLWDQEQSEFIPLTNISTFRDLLQGNYEESLSAEKAKLAGEVIRIGYREEINLLMFEENSTRITGLLGDMWTMLSEYLNFTIEIIKVADDSGIVASSTGNFTGLLGMIQRKEIDIIPRATFHDSTWDIIEYSTPLWTNRFKIYVQPEFVSDDTWIFKTFTFHAWLSIVGLMTSFSIMGIVIDKLVAKKKITDTNYIYLFLDHYFHTFATFCNQGSFPENVEKRSLSMTFSRRACAWLVVSMMSTTLVSKMTSKEMKLSFNGVHDLLNNTDYLLVVRNTTLTFHDMKKEILQKDIRQYRNRIIMVNTAEEMYSMACDTKIKAAALGADDRQRAMAKTLCPLISAPKNYYPMWVTAGIVKGFEFKRPIDNGILKIIEVGLLTALKDRWLSRSLLWTPEKTTDVSIEQVYLIFIVLLVGAMISLIVFLIEHIVVIRRRYHLRGKWNNQLYQQAKRLRIYRQIKKPPKRISERKIKKIKYRKKHQKQESK